MWIVAVGVSLLFIMFVFLPNIPFGEEDEVSSIRVERVFVGEREAICFINNNTELDCEWMDQ